MKFLDHSLRTEWICVLTKVLVTKISYSLIHKYYKTVGNFFFYVNAIIVPTLQF